MPDVVDAKRVSQARAGLPDPRVLADAVEVFKALANPLRVSIIHALIHDEMSVGDLARALDVSQTVASQQLSVLRRLRLVAGRDDGRNTFYRVVDELVGHLVHDCLAHVDGARDHVQYHRRRAEPPAKQRRSGSPPRRSTRTSGSKQ